MMNALRFFAFSMLVPALAMADARGLVKNRGGGSAILFRLLESIASSDECTGSLTGVTTARTSSAYCTKSDGTMTLLGANTPRVEGAGLFSEPQAQNVALRSEEIDNAAWTKTNSTVSATNSSAPMGSVAETLLATAGNARHNISGAYTATAAAWTCSAIVKAGSGITYAWLSIDNGSNYTHFNLSTGAKATEGAGNTGAILPLSSSYYRIAVTRTMGAGATNVQLGMATADAAATFNAAGTETLLVTAMQCELGSVATSYTPTLGTAVTRTAEEHNATNPLATGTATWCVGATATPQLSWSAGVVRWILDIGTRDTADSASVSVRASLEPYFYTFDAVGSFRTAIGGTSFSGTTAKRVSVSNSSGTFAMKVDGSAVGLTLGGAGTGIVDPMPATIAIGSSNIPDFPLNGWVKNIIIGRSAEACQ